MKQKLLALGLATVAMGTTFAAPVAISLKSTLGEGTTVEKVEYQLMIRSELDGGVAPLLNPESGIYKTAANYKKCESTYYYEAGKDIYYPKNLDVTWECDFNADYYNFEIGLKSDLSDAQSYVTFAKSMELPNLFAAKKYYYRITARSETQTVRSRVFSFQTAALPRTITVPGVSNTRDIGGYYTVDGKYQVKQGIFYRGGAITAAGVDTLLNTYGIKTDLDVRGDGSSTTIGSPLGSGVNYVECTGPYYLGNVGINTSDKTYRNALLREIQTCAVKENYPIYLHCTLGRDRTGTLAFLIGALLGVGEMDLFMDYELSFFSEAGTRDNQTPTHMVGSAFRGMYNYIANYAKGTLQENAEQFMLDLGVTAEEITSIREILLEEV